MNRVSSSKAAAGAVALAALAAVFAGGQGTTSAHAQTQQSAPAPAKPAPQAPYAVSYVKRISVRANGTATQASTVRHKILAPGAIQPLSQQRLGFVEGMQTLKVVEAFTLKADGRKVPVDAASIITRDGGSESLATYERDLKERIIIFPNVEVGDTLVSTYEEQILGGVFPGQYYHAETFARSIPYASAQIIVEAPKTLELRVKTLASGLTDRVEEVGAVRRHIVTLAPRPYAPEEPGAVAPIDRDPALLISTFKSYEQLGLAYRTAAMPKAVVTPEIAELAGEITRGIEDKKAQAAAIDAWMKKNIRYVAVYLSLGRVVPNSAASVLRNRFGDCKDKATLMAALLAAKGIASEQVLINLGNAYTLPEPPTLAALNHAILYLPELDLYADPTVSQAAFGVLAPEGYDKPVVRVSAAGVTLARTPAMAAQQHVYRVRTLINVAADGSLSGRTAESGSGVFGLVLRTGATAVQNLGSETAAQRQLQSFNTPGAGRYELGNSAETADPVTVTNAFQINERLSLPSSGFAYIPIGMPLLVRPGSFLLGQRLNGRTSAFACYAGWQVEDMEVTFALGLPMPAPKPSGSLTNAAFTYRATFTVEGRTLKIHREFISHVGQQTCAPELEEQIAGHTTILGGNLSNVFQFGAVASAAPAKPAQPAEPARTVPPAPTAAKPPQIVEMRRAIPSDQKRRIDFIYWLEPDCSVPELPVLRVIEQPRSGKLSIEHGTGFPNFAPSNPRYECNRRKAEGIVLAYEPAARFTGTDSITVEIIYPLGYSAKRHYAIDVKAVENISSVPNPTPTN